MVRSVPPWRRSTLQKGTRVPASSDVPDMSLPAAPSGRGTTRRRVLAVAAAAAAAPLVGAGPATAAEADGCPVYDLTLLGTSDTHGNVCNWDYYRDAEYDDSAHNDVGLA